MNFYICVSGKISPIHQPVVTPISDVWWPGEYGSEMFVPQKCHGSFLATPPVLSGPATLCLPSPPLDSAKKKKETKNNGWVISYVSSQHHNSSMSVKSLLYFRPPPPFIRFGDSKGAADSSYRIIWLVSKYKSFSRRWPMIKSSFFRPVIQDWLPEDIQQNSTY